MEISVLAGKVDGLTPRQKEVLELVAKDLKNTAIADRLGIAYSGVNKYISELYEAFGLGPALGNNARRLKLKEIWSEYQALLEPSDAQASEAPAVDDTPAADPPDSPASSGTGPTVGISIPLANPASIKGLLMLSMNDPEFSSRFTDHIANGYKPEHLIEYQSLAGAERAVTRIVFIKRS